MADRGWPALVPDLSIPSHDGIANARIPAALRVCCIDCCLLCQRQPVHIQASDQKLDFQDEAILFVAAGCLCQACLSA